MRAVIQERHSVATPLQEHIRAAIAAAGGWIGFDRFMALALYSPGLGYYANDSAKFGALPASGSDFVTAPELTPLFGQTLAVQLAQALEATQTHELWEFGAGSGALALHLLDALGERVRRYTIVDLSASLRVRQQTRLAAHAHKLRWMDALPEKFSGVVLGNELLDAMPVQLLARHGGQRGGIWHERGVVSGDDGALAWSDRPTGLRPPVEIEGPQDYLTEIHAQAEAFIRTLADRLARGAVFLLDYGFGASEYYHPQRHMGTLMCHRGHRADGDPLTQVGHKDISAHVNFSALALAAQQAGLHVLGYTTQAHFLINCGLPEKMQHASIAERARAAPLIMEHEMGELFKVLALGAGVAWEPLGFARGDRTHRL
ncbi:class I SAM-dependent methyltransferase [Verminephrobacter aporrectodeae subsp. tuberculatae]|uniref:Class I SAM-dependent methyltransferase n=1 Tax=Verminephrobacter aporrectodeae subsp. tuberculatae TaxID=1110392 RepID=A0ABT3KZX2_9BURK|nr:SAM-dependent methyltransferase [Verminephrobacter aporrectodeae]MCW5323542.1 class I SAM-dependent methyltransferase [Verminephrobacter aporrectodeae subsp. tuberculatae]